MFLKFHTIYSRFINFFSDNHCAMIFIPYFLVKDLISGMTLFQDSNQNGLYPLFSTSTNLQDPRTALIRVKAPVSTWYLQLGHPSTLVLQHIIFRLPSTGTTSTLSMCEACWLDKSLKLPFQSSIKRANHPIQLLRIDLWGPSPTTSYQGHRYYISNVDDCTRFFWIYFLWTKSKLITIFCNY